MPSGLRLVTDSTSRFFIYAEQAGRWRQIHHHRSIDGSELLARYPATINRN